MKTKFNTLTITFICCAILLLLACHKKKFHPDACFTVANSVMLVGDTIKIEFCGNISRNTEWSMGDGTTYEQAEPPKHIYQTKGTYAINLKSTEHVDGFGIFTHWQKRAVSEAQQTVTVQ